MHDIGIAHRDLKLENIMLTSLDDHPQLKIIDFGLSCQFDPDDNSETKFKTLVGTPHYLAPEVISQNYSEKCDIWALGVVAY